MIRFTGKKKIQDREAYCEERAKYIPLNVFHRDKISGEEAAVMSQPDNTVAPNSREGAGTKRATAE